MTVFIVQKKQIYSKSSGEKAATIPIIEFQESKKEETAMSGATSKAE